MTARKRQRLPVHRRLLSFGRGRCFSVAQAFQPDARDRRELAFGVLVEIGLEETRIAALADRLPEGQFDRVVGGLDCVGIAVTVGIGEPRPRQRSKMSVRTTFQIGRQFLGTLAVLDRVPEGEVEFVGGYGRAVEGGLAGLGQRAELASYLEKYP